MLGPLGNGFDLDVARPLLVGGGIGIAPLPYVAQVLGDVPAILGFRTAHHAEAAALVPGAEVVVEPTFVTELLPDDPVDVLACGPEPMLEAVRRLAPARPARVGGADGLRLRRLLRLRRRARRPPAAALHRRPCAAGGVTVTVPILNASGCLDALTAPDVARALDAFVTKTITPEPREGNPPVRIAETESRDAQLDRAPGARASTACSTHTLPALAALRDCASGSRSAASRSATMPGSASGSTSGRTSR